MQHLSRNQNLEQTKANKRFGKEPKHFHGISLQIVANPPLCLGWFFERLIQFVLHPCTYPTLVDTAFQNNSHHAIWKISTSHWDVVFQITAQVCPLIVILVPLQVFCSSIQKKSNVLWYWTHLLNICFNSMNHTGFSGFPTLLTNVLVNHCCTFWATLREVW